MPKDYHKGFKLQVYIPEELADLLDLHAKAYGCSKKQIVVDALYSFIGKSARDSIKNNILINTQNKMCL